MLMRVLVRKGEMQISLIFTISKKKKTRKKKQQQQKASVHTILSFHFLFRPP